MTSCCECALTNGRDPTINHSMLRVSEVVPVSEGVAGKFLLSHDASCFFLSSTGSEARKYLLHELSDAVIFMFPPQFQTGLDEIFVRENKICSEDNYEIVSNLQLDI